MKTRVYVIESEAGWGQKVDEIKEFDTPELALTYCKEYNNKHNPPTNSTPDWYMYARLEGQNCGMIR